MLFFLNTLNTAGFVSYLQVGSGCLSPSLEKMEIHFCSSVGICRFLVLALFISCFCLEEAPSHLSEHIELPRGQNT